MAPEATGLSDRQFKRKVFEELQNAGTIDGLKGNLRSRLVGVLQRRDPNVFAGSGPGQQSLWQRAANSLYVEYLASQNYTYSLSVFQPECGLTNQQVMTRDELSRVLSLGGSIASYLPKSPVDGSEPPLLLKLLQGVADMGGVNTRREMQTQTDDFDNNTSLALRMQQIDEMHERAVETERLAPLRDAEERMSAFQKECEARLRVEMDEQVRRVRDYEVGQARLEEAAKHRRHLADAREELERVHAERLRKLRAREESQMERVRSAEAALERAAYDHRQRLAAEHETLRAAKDAWEKEQAEREMKRARAIETFARRESEMTTKEQAWSLRYAEASAEAEERVATRRRETDVDAKRRLETVTSEMAAIAEERARLESERAQHAEEMAALSRARKDAAAARQKRGRTRRRGGYPQHPARRFARAAGRGARRVGETRDSASRQSRGGWRRHRSGDELGGRVQLGSSIRAGCGGDGARQGGGGGGATGNRAAAQRPLEDQAGTQLGDAGAERRHSRGCRVEGEVRTREQDGG